MLNPRSTPEQQRLALLFAQHLTSAESGASLASLAKRLPANRNAVIGDNPLLQGFMNQAATAQSMPNRPEMEEVWGYAGDMVVKVVDGNADPDGYGAGDGGADQRGKREVEVLTTSFQLFNLQTMSGVFPGTRTMVFQRVRVRPIGQDDEEQGAAQWARLLWYEEPAACVVELGSILLRIPEPLRGDFGKRLEEALAANGLRLMACGSCAFWQPMAVQTGDGLPAGRCIVRGNAGEDACAPDALAAQSALGVELQPLAGGRWRTRMVAADGEEVQQGVARRDAQE